MTSQGDLPTQEDRPLIGVFDLFTGRGGAPRVVATVWPQLTGRYRVEVLNPYGNAPYAEMYRGTAVEVSNLVRPPPTPYIGGKGKIDRLLRVIGRTPWMLWTMWSLRKWVLRNKPAAVYFNQEKTAAVFSTLLPWRTVPLVYHSHGHASSEAIRPWIVRALVRRFAAILAVSKKTADLLVEAGVPRDRITVVYNGVNAPAVRASAARPGPALPPRGEQDVVFVLAAQIAPRKGVHLAVEAMHLLSPALNARLWICGDVVSGGDCAYLDSLKARAVELGLQDRISFLGWREDVHRIFAAAEVVILPSPSHAESFGMVLAEAMVLGRPCIGSCMGGVPEVIDDGVTGLVCPPTAEGLAKAMETLAASVAKRKAFGEAGARRVETCFSVERQVQSIADILKGVIARASQSR